jgi:hypothetical protein
MFTTHNDEVNFLAHFVHLPELGHQRNARGSITLSSTDHEVWAEGVRYLGRGYGV